MHVGNFMPLRGIEIIASNVILQIIVTLVRKHCSQQYHVNGQFKPHSNAMIMVYANLAIMQL